MKLNRLHRDALTEMGNIGISRAAHQLSALLGEKIHVQAPAAELVTLRQIERDLDLGVGDVSCIYQELCGGVQGRMALLLGASDRHALLKALHGDIGLTSPVPLQIYEHEALLEIGNIMISSCISAVADLLNLHIDINVPHYAEVDLMELLEIREFAGDSPAGLLMHALLRSEQSKIASEVLLILSSSAMKSILATLLPQMEEVQVDWTENEQ